MTLITLAQAKTQLDIGADNTSRDDELQLWIDATTEAVETAKGAIVDQRSFTEEIDCGAGTLGVLLSNVPVASLTSVQSADGSQTWDTANLHVNTATGAVTVLSGPQLRGKVVFVYPAGPDTPRASHRVAGLIILQHLWETRRGAMGVPRGGDDEVYVPQLGYAIPRRAAELLGLTLPGIA